MDELPSSSSLYNNIEEALGQSEFLIVICTPRLQESKWCMREIELFQKLRGSDHIIVEFEKGDTIVTSGYSAIFPSGIIVGKVVNFEKQHDDNFYSLEVELATDFQALNNVRIIKNYRQAEQKNTEREAKKND